MLLTVVVVNWNSRDDLEGCLLSLERQTHRDLEVIVVDNGSTDGSVELLGRRFPQATLVTECQNLGFAEACNRAIAKSHGAWIVTLNNDAVADSDSARALVATAESCVPECGMLQSLLVYMDRPEVVNSTGIVLAPDGGGRDRDEGRWRVTGTELEEIFCPTAGAAAYRRSMLDSIRLPSGYFDPDHFMYYEDLDLGWRARLAGWTALYVPSSSVRHKWHGSTQRHAERWLVLKLDTNRVRLLVKNASLGMIVRTARRTAQDTVEIARLGGLRALAELARAVARGLRARGRVGRMAKRRRADVEREWVGR
jgi:GT2 family glycosyltransferase